MEKISKSFHLLFSKWSNNWIILSMIITLKIICFLLINSLRKRIHLENENHQQIFDLSMANFIDISDFYHILSVKYTEYSRYLYLLHTLFELTGYLCIHFIFSCVLIIQFTDNLFISLYLPALIFILDYIENIILISVLYTFPSLLQIPWLINIGLKYVICIKWYLNILFILCFTWFLMKMLPKLCQLESLKKEDIKKD